MKLAPLLLAIAVLTVAPPAQAARSSAPLLRNILGTWCGTSKLTITPTRFIISRGPDTPPQEFGAHYVRLEHSIAITYFVFHDFPEPPPPPYVTYMFSRLSRDGTRMTQARYDGRMVVSRIKRCS
jgi:hypothetical protein